MRIILAAVAAAFVLAGCSQPVAGTPTPEPQRIDCDLIFPGPGGA